MVSVKLRGRGWTSTALGPKLVCPVYACSRRHFPLGRLAWRGPLSCRDFLSSLHLLILPFLNTPPPETETRSLVTPSLTVFLRKLVNWSQKSYFEKEQIENSKTPPAETPLSRKIHKVRKFIATPDWCLIIIASLSWKTQGMFSFCICSQRVENRGSCHKRQRRKRQSVTAKREKSQTPKVLTAIQ